MNIAYNMDCMEYMRSLPDKYFDLAVVDPPYGIGITGAHPSTHTRIVSGGFRPFGGKNNGLGKNRKAAARQIFIPCSTTPPRRTRNTSGSWNV